MSPNGSRLDPEIYKLIKEYCAQGDELAVRRNYSSAIDQYNKAWIIIPEPKDEWEASSRVLAAIADACYLSRYYVSARDALAYAMTCPGAFGTPLLHLRYGQVLHYFGDFDRAANELELAYLSGGSAVFSNEDSKYIKFLKSHIKISIRESKGVYRHTVKVDVLAFGAFRIIVGSALARMRGRQLFGPARSVNNVFAGAQTDYDRM